MKLKAVLAIAFLSLQSLAFADGTEPLSDEVVKARSEAINKTLRCTVCQNQTIADSHAFLAEDMRALVEQRVRLGETDEEVRAYMRSKYGDFVLITPPVQLSTILLWTGPFLLLLAGSVWYFRNFRHSPPEAGSGDMEEDLSDADRQRLNDLLNTKVSEDKTS